MGRGVFCRDEGGGLSLGYVFSSLMVGVMCDVDYVVVVVLSFLAYNDIEKSVLQNRLNVIFRYPW